MSPAVHIGRPYAAEDFEEMGTDDNVFQADGERAHMAAILGKAINTVYDRHLTGRREDRCILRDRPPFPLPPQYLSS